MSGLTSLVWYGNHWAVASYVGLSSMDCRQKWTVFSAVKFEQLNRVYGGKDKLVTISFQWARGK